MSWKSLLQQSLRANEALQHSKYMQISTVRPDGRPAARTVVYRGFLWDSDRLTFVTDARSRKVAELASNPWAEIAWYFPESREQYRLLGRVTVVGGDSSEPDMQRARTEAWQRMSGAGRQQFLWPHPGLPRGEEGGALFNSPTPAREDPVVDAFCLCVVAVERVDHLCLATNTRHVYERRGEGWAEDDVTP